jgi:sugar/nucleoside kinase (ribokinase family)
MIDAKVVTSHDRRTELMTEAVTGSPDVWCLGLIVADHVAAPVPALPESGGLVCTPRTELTIGGCAANVAVNLAKLGMSAGIVGCVGDDVLGRFVHERLAHSGVDCRRLILSSTAQTATTLVVNVTGEDRRFIHAVGANAELTGRELNGADLERARMVYVGGFGLNPALSGEHVAALFAAARAAGVRTLLDVVVADASSLRPMLEPVLPVTDVFLPNSDEGRMITGLDAPRAQAEFFRHLGASTVIVTRGKRGSLVLHAGECWEAPAHDVQEVDGTGGGDAFAAGFMYGLRRGADVPQSLQFAAALGASCVQSAGATTGTFTAPELEAFVRTHPLPIRHG